MSPSSDPPSSSPPPPPPILIALSGPTSTGKTTLSHLLLRLLTTTNTTPPPLLIHADDFYLPDSQIPVRDEDGIQDWDCAAALDWGRFWSVVEGVKRGEDVLRDLVRQGGVGDEEREGDGVHAPIVTKGIDQTTITSITKQVSSWPPHLLVHNRRRIILLEGFLLFGSSLLPRALSTFDICILLRTTRARAKARREKRNGYVTLEGFWQDPEGYFDRVVWPGWEREHGWVFEGGNVEGWVRREVGGGKVGGGRVVVQPLEEGESLERSAEWLVGVLRGGLERVVRGGGEGNGGGLES